MAKKQESAESTVRNIRRNTRKKYSAEEKIRIVLEGLRGDNTIAELCRRHGHARYGVKRAKDVPALKAVS